MVIVVMAVMAVVVASVNDHHVLFPPREIGPCVFSLQASRSFAQLPASAQPLNPVNDHRGHKSTVVIVVMAVVVASATDHGGKQQNCGDSGDGNGGGQCQ